MRVSVLASGSSGNSTYINIGGKHILIDIGVSCLYIEKKLKEINVVPSMIDYVFITHNHIDHINGLRVFYKKYRPNIIFETIDEESLLNYGESLISIENFNLFSDISIEKINLSHDSKSIGFIFEYNEKSLVYVTDTGYIKDTELVKIKNKTCYIFESNHDVEMLMESRRPHHIKVRILGDEGHLSNEDSAMYLQKIVGKNTRDIILAHLSSEANTPEKAMYSAKNLLPENINIICAQKKEIVEISYD